LSREDNAYFLIDFNNYERLPELATIKGYKFWVPDPETGIPFTLGMSETLLYEKAQELFDNRVYVLAYELHLYLLQQYLVRKVDVMRLRADALSPVMAQCLEGWKEKRDRRQAALTPRDLMRFLITVQIATSEGVKNNRPPDLTAALEGYPDLSEREAHFDALVDLILRRRGDQPAAGRGIATGHAGPSLG
jgi:hypothetical protein